MLLTIDNFIICRLEAFCHWTQRLAGITSVLWARLTLLLAGTLIVSDVLAGVEVKLLWLCWPVILLGFFVDYKNADKHKQLADSLTANPRKLSQRKWRIVGLFIICLSITDRLLKTYEMSFWFELSVLAEYLLCCDDLPSAPSKLRQFIDSFKPAPVPQGSNARSGLCW